MVQVLMEESLVRRVGNGADTFFWTYPWLGRAHLCVRFQHLFNMAENKLSTVTDMCGLGWENGGVAWQWCRRFWVWEDELLGQCMILLHNISLQSNSTDKLYQILDPSGGYLVRGVYTLLTSRKSHRLNATSDLIWCNPVPLKVFILAWRLFRNRLPTKDNLVTRGIISHNSQLCMTSCGA